MNCKDVKQFHISDYLKRLGHIPKRVFNGNEYYYSPLREETTASFHVNTNKNVWFDFGTGTGGDLLKLVCTLDNCTVPEALQHIEKIFFFSPANNITHERGAGEKKKEAIITINSISELKHPVLLNYLRERKINTAIAAVWLKQIYYTINEKKYFALAFVNSSGGVEVRNKYFKGCIGKKDVTLIQFNHLPQINMFEGFTDYLSYLTHFNIYKSEYNCIIFNSLALFDYKNWIGEFTCNCYFDNDTAGQKAYTDLKRANPKAINKSLQLYPDYKDFNDFLTGKKMNINPQK